MTTFYFVPKLVLQVSGGYLARVTSREEWTTLQDYLTDHVATNICRFLKGTVA
jgi:hypothetical protein